MKHFIVIALTALIISSCKKEFNTPPVSSSQASNNTQNLHPTGVILDDPSLVEKIGYYSTAQNLSKGPLPSYIDLSNDMPNVGNQGSQGSCVGWAVGYYCKTYHEAVEKKWGEDQNVYSPSWVYNQINGGKDGGASIADAMDLLVNKGCDFIDNFPYSSFDYKTRPDNASLTNSAHYKAQSWKYLGKTVTDFKTVLASGQPVVISIPVYPDFDNLNSGNQIYDNWSGSIRGYHALCVIGYDDTKQAIKIENSWGTSWGINGYGWIAYDKIPDINNAYVLTDKANVYDTQYLLGDFNGDKTQDIFTANGYGFYVSWTGVNGFKQLQESGALLTNMLVGDFNGDGKSDILLANGFAWSISYSGTGAFIKTKTTTVKAGSLKIGDFNGDGKSDILYATGTELDISYSGTGTLVKLNTCSAAASDLATGDFNGDGKSDVFRTTGSEWDVSYSGGGAWTKINTSSFKMSLLKLGDFDGDGKCDVFTTLASYWYVNYSGTGSWTNITTSSYFVSEVQLGNHNASTKYGGNKCDVYHVSSSKMEVYLSENSNWCVL